MDTRLPLKIFLLAAACLGFAIAFAGSASAQSRYTYCAEEGQWCSFSGTKDVFYGAEGKNAYKYGVTGGIACNNNVFGDPNPGVHKRCYIKDSMGPTYIGPADPNQPTFVDRRSITIDVEGPIEWGGYGWFQCFELPSTGGGNLGWSQKHTIISGWYFIDERGQAYYRYYDGVKGPYVVTRQYSYYACWNP